MFREKHNKILIILLFIGFQHAGAKAPTDGNGWYQAAVTARQDERISDAYEALKEAEALSFSPVRLSFERARLATLSDDQDKAAAELESIEQTGFAGVGFIVNDPILSSLEGHEY